MVDYLVWLVYSLEQPADAAAHEALHAESRFHEPAELLAPEVHANGRRLEGEHEVVLGFAAIGEGKSPTGGQLGVQAHVRPVQPRELHDRHHARHAQLELPVGRLVPVAGHGQRRRRHIVAHRRPAEAEPIVDIMDILHAHGADHLRILEREMPDRERRPEHPAHHIGELRNRKLSIRNGKLVPVLVILGKDGHNDDNTQDKCN